jgi:AbiV
MNNGAAATDAALRAVAANTVRHLLEADQHYKARRYPSATASAVLSIEESGKLAFLAATGSAPKAKGRRRHALHSILFVALLKTFGSPGWDWRKILAGGDASELTAQQQQMIVDHPEFSDFVRRVQAGELDDLGERQKEWAAAMTAKEQRDGTIKQWLPLITGGLQELRLAATYVDVGESGDTVRAPDLNDAVMPELLCAGAMGLLLLVLALASSQRETLDVQDLAGSMPDDLTGFDVLRRVFPGLGRVTAARPGAIHRLVRRREQAESQTKGLPSK